jgi:hypothetical protein
MTVSDVISSGEKNTRENILWRGGRGAYWLAAVALFVRKSQAPLFGFPRR